MILEANKRYFIASLGENNTATLADLETGVVVPIRLTNGWTGTITVGTITDKRPTEIRFVNGLLTGSDNETYYAHGLLGTGKLA